MILSQAQDKQIEEGFQKFIDESGRDALKTAFLAGAIVGIEIAKAIYTEDTESSTGADKEDTPPT